MPRNTLLLAPFLALVGACMACVPTSAEDLDKGWVLTQRSQTLGDQYVYLSAHGLKCINPKEGIGFIARAPGWDVVLFNDKTKLCYHTTVDKWKQVLARRGIRSQDITQAGWIKCQTQSIAGLKATQYVRKADDEAAQMLSNLTAKRGKPIKSAEYWVSDDIAVPSKLVHMLETAYSLPSSQSIPLRLSYLKHNGDHELLLDTYRAQKTFIPESFFNLKPGFKSAKTEAAVLINDETRQMLDDLAQELSTDSYKSYTQSTDPIKSVSISQSGSQSEIRSKSQSAKNQPASKSGVLSNETGEDLNKLIEIYKQYKNRR